MGILHFSLLDLSITPFTSRTCSPASSGLSHWSVPGKSNSKRRQSSSASSFSCDDTPGSVTTLYPDGKFASFHIQIAIPLHMIITFFSVNSR